MKKPILVLLILLFFACSTNAQKQKDSDVILKKYSSLFEWIIKPKYNFIFNVPENNILTVMQKVKYGYMTLQEEMIVPFQWGYASKAGLDSLGIVGKSTDHFKTYLDLNNNGKVVLEGKFLYAGRFKDGYAVLGVSTNPKYGIIDYEGNFVLECRFGYIDSPDNIKDILEGRSDDLIPVKEYKGSGMGSYGYINAKGEWMKKPIYARTYPKDGDFYPVSYTYFKNDKGLLDSEANEIIPFEYETFIIIDHEHIQARKKDEKWGVLNKNNEIVFDFEYDLIAPFDQSNKAYFEKGKEYGYIYLDNAEVEIKGTLDRDPIKYFYGYAKNNQYGVFSFKEYHNSKLLGICLFENDKLHVKIPQEFNRVYIENIGDRQYIFVRKKFGSKKFYGLFNDKLEKLVDVDLKEFDYIGTPNSSGYMTIKIRDKYGVAKFNK